MKHYKKRIQFRSGGKWLPLKLDRQGSKSQINKKPCKEISVCNRSDPMKGNLRRLNELSEVWCGQIQEWTMMTHATRPLLCCRNHSMHMAVCCMSWSDYHDSHIFTLHMGKLRYIECQEVDYVTWTVSIVNFELMLDLQKHSFPHNSWW